MTFTAFDAYRTYLAMKNHFSQKGYDYFKYNGKVNVGQSSFETRRDKYQFHKLSKVKDPERYLVANFINRDVKWIGDLLGDDAESTYADWLKRQQSLTYNFQLDLNKLEPEFQDNLIVKDGQHPYLLKLYRQGIVSIETMVILNNLVNFFPYWNKEITDTVLWPDLCTKIEKYKPFVEFDVEKCKNILHSTFEI